MSTRNPSIEVILIVLLCILFPTPEAVSPFRQRNICGPATCLGGKKFHFKEGNAYLYQYSINGTTSIYKGPTEQSGLHISAQVALKFISPCEAILFIREVDLWQSYAASTPTRGEAEHKFSRQDTEHQFRSALEEFPLRFSYADGFIEEVCPDTREAPWVLNVKRGLLSALQNTMRRLDLEHKGQEDDIHGLCHADYKIGTATASSLTIDKMKDINSCGDKFGIFSSVQGTPYHFGTKYQSMPAVASTSECHQMVDRNLISKVVCSETHRLRTLSRGVAGVVSSIQQTLELTSIYDPNYVPPEEAAKNQDDGFGEDSNSTPHSSDGDGNGNDGGIKEEDETETNLPAISKTLPPLFDQLVTNYNPEIVFKRESLHFKHDYNMDPSSTSDANDLQAGKKALEDFCSSVKGEVSSTSGKYFDALVTIMRGFNYEDLRTLSEDAVRICEGDRTHFDDALEAVGSAASIGVIKEKILQKGVPAETIHSWIASLTYIPNPDLDLMEAAVDILKERETYPQILLSYSSLANAYCRHAPLCERHRPIAILTKLYEKMFTTGCIPSKPKLIEQLIMYLKGIGNFGQFSEGINTALLTCISKSEREEIKVAAIDAYRRMHCNSDQTVLNKVFQSESEDSEVRIAAFIGLMRCPTYSTIRSIKETLEKEQVNQVGSFVWTYLKNLQKTALPSKAELQGLIADENLSKKFAIDVRKFSRNFEISTFHDDLNFGVGLESNVIFSPKSYLPRSLMLNLTVDLFGESINVLEAGVRVENFEHFIESLVGPKGAFRNQDLHSLISSLRQKRAVPSKRKLRTLTMEYDAHKRYYSDPIASFSLKTFGNEILYERRAGTQETNFMDLLNPFEHIKQLGNKNIDWKKSKLLLESSYIIPTGVGVPLNLSAHASTILRLNTMSLMDIENIRAGAELKMHGKFEPSALLTVKGSMAFGTGAFQTGIQVRAQIHTSTAFEGSFHMKGTKLLKINVGLPKTKQELLEYKSDVLFMNGNTFHAVGQLPIRNPVCTNGFLDNTLGIKFCKSSYFSLSPGSERDNILSPYFPLNGPAQFAITVEKTNPTHLSTSLNYEYENDEQGTKLIAMYEVEGTQTTKLLGFNYLLNKVTKDFNFEVNVPHNMLQAHGYVKDAKNGGLNITTVSNGEQIFNALLTYIRPDSTRLSDDVSKMNMDVDILVTTTSENKLLDAKVKVTPSESNTGVSVDGTGRLYLVNDNNVNLIIKGQLNETRLETEIEGQYRGRSSSAPQTIKWQSTLNKWRPSSDAQQIDTFLNLEFSEFPDYNLDTTWKYQKNDDGFSSHLDFRLGKGPTWSDNSAIRIKQSVVSQTNFESSRREISFWVSQPSKQINFGFETAYNTDGRNLDSTINLRITQEKNFQTSLSLQRAPGVLTFLQIGWNTTISNQPPLAISLYLQETASRVYQGKFQTDWFGSNNINIGLNFMDRTKRQQYNRELKLSVETSTMTPFVISVLILHDPEKETKFLLKTEYQNHAMSWELNRKLENKGKKRGLVLSFRNGPKTYFINSDMNITHTGFEWTLRTDLQSKFPDILLQTRMRSETGTQNSVYLLYKWNARVDESQKLVLDFVMDATRQNTGRQIELKFDYPGQKLWVTGQFVKNNIEGKNRLLVGQILWNDDIRLNGNASFNMSPMNTEAEIAVSLRRTHMSDTSCAVRLSCDKQVDCLLKADANWGSSENMNLVLETEFRFLPPEEIQDADEDNEDYDTTKSMDYDGDDDDEGGNSNESDERNQLESGRSRSKTSSNFISFRPFSLSARGNLLSTLNDWTKDVKISMRHTQQSPLHHKTDTDIQFPNGKDINIASHWVIPVTLKQIWSTRAELHVRTPFQTLQNFQLQTIIGHQEDSDTLATAGIYMDNAQYSITLTGTPRFAEDGSLRVEISTSNPAYDKIFSSLSYATGDSAKLAFQLGWPNVVISLEAGLEWDGSLDEFEVFFTLTSPWKPIKHINTLAKIDISQQVELKVEVNDNGLGLKCEWVIENFATFDIRLEGTTPFPALQKIGFLLKNSFEDDIAYHSQVSLYANEKQIGYKLEGGRSDVEEGAIVANMMNSQIEIDTYIYPPIRSTFNLAQRESKFNLGLSLLLREGPINVLVELHLLDLFSFNENIRITTPYPGLFELELNLSPAFHPERDVYNMVTHVKWRSGSEWEKSGMTLRYGDQSAYQSILQEHLENEVEDDDYEDEDYDYNQDKRTSVEPKPKPTVNVDQSQLFHFYSPIKWVKVLKIEYEKVKSADVAKTESATKKSGEDEYGDDDDDDVSDQVGAPETQTKTINSAVFPLRTLAFIFSTENSLISADLHNEPTKKQIGGQLDLRAIEEPLSVKFETKFDASSPERKLNINAISYQPTLEQFTVSTTWQTRPGYMSAVFEARTPFENWEVQSLSAMHAENAVQKVSTHDYELKSETFGKLGANVVLGPGELTLSLTTPFEGYKELELSGLSNPVDGFPGKLNTAVTLKSQEATILEIGVDSTTENGVPVELSGTVTTTLRGYADGNLRANIETTANLVNASGSIDWNEQKLKVKLTVKFPKSKFEALDLRVETPFRNYEKWRVYIQQEDDINSAEDEEDYNETDDDDDDLDTDNESPENETKGTDAFTFIFKIDTPIQGFTTITGKGEFPTVVSSYHTVNKVTLSGKAPSGSIDIMTSWIISDWNSFDIHCDSKYSHSITKLTFMPSALRSLPEQNSLKFKLRNVVPSLNVLSLIDSAFYYETEQPAFRLGSTALVKVQPGKSTTVKLSAKLPQNMHTIDIQSEYDANLSALQVDGAYIHGFPSKTWNSHLQMTRNAGILQGGAEIDLGKSNPLQSKFNYSTVGDISEFHLRAYTKNEPDIPIATVDGIFDSQTNRHKVRLYAVDPTHSSQPILVDLNAEYKNLLNFDSSLHATTPYDTVPTFGLRGSSATAPGNVYKGVFGGHLADDITLMKYELAFDNLYDLKKFNGSFAVILPFEQFQSGSVGGSYHNKLTSFDSTLRAEFNEIVYVDALHTRETSSKAGIEKEIDKLELDNPFWPIGISKLYQYEYSGGYNGLNLPTKTTRLLEAYNLVQRELHKLGGELRIRTDFNGREITLSGIHPNRRLDLNTNYEFLNHQFKHATNFSYSSSSWLGYEISIQNKTTYAKAEHEVDVKISYPVRVIAVNVGCLSEESSIKLTTNLNLNASQNEGRKLTGVFQWSAEDESYFRRGNIQKMSIMLKHPSLAKDIRAEGRFHLSEEETLAGDLSLDYSGDPEKNILVKIRSQLPFQQLRQNNYYFWNLTSDIRLLHPTTDLDLKAFSSTQHSPHELSIITLIDFKNREKLVRKSKISFELFKQLRELHVMLSNPDEYISYRGELSGQHPVYHANMETNMTGTDPHFKGQMVVDLAKPYFRMYAVTGRDLTDGLYSEGGIVDSRNAKFHIYESYDNFKFSDVNFLLRMNHSRLVTSKLKWRPELFQELQDLHAKEMERLKLIWNQQTDKLVRTVYSDVNEVVEQIWESAQTHVGTFLAEMTEDVDFGKDSAAFQQFLQDTKDNNDFYSQDIAGIVQVFADEVSVRYANVYIKIRQYRQELLGDTTTSEMFENALLWFLEKMKDVYRSTKSAWKQIRIETPSWTPTSATAFSFMDDLKEKVLEVFHEATESIMEAGANISYSIQGTFSNIGHAVGAYCIRVFEENKQSLFTVLHRVEAVLYAIIVDISDYIYATQTQVRTSNIYQNMANLARDIDHLYNDLQRYSARTNFRKYSSLLRNFIRKKYGDIDEYQKQWGEMGKQIGELWQRFTSIPPIASLKNSLISLKEHSAWTIQYFKIEQLVQEIVLTLYNRGHDLLYQTVIEANDRYLQFKTRFVFDIEKGNIEWEQKLPMPWSAFNDTPVVKELPEYKTFMKLRSLYQSSSNMGDRSGSIWNAYYTTEQSPISTQEWLPPFDGQAMMIGSNKFYTFDGRFYTFTGPCAYLLTSDLVDGNFSLAIQYKRLRDGSLGHETVVAAGHNTLIFDFEAKALRDPKKNSSAVLLPVQMQHLQGYQDNSNLVVQHAGNAFTFTCNMNYQICQLKVSGWYSRKVGGLLGTMDEEPTTDLTKANGQTTLDPAIMARSWDVSDENVEPCMDSTIQPMTSAEMINPQTISNCNKFFANQLSSLQPCFNMLNVTPYMDICLNESSGSVSKMCTSAMAYVSACRGSGINVEVPSTCVRCDLNGKEMMDRDIKVIDSATTGSSKSTDVVLLIEAKDCNRHVRVKKRMNNLINELEIELNRGGLRNNRYAVVAFGGTGVYIEPHSIAYNSQIFTTARQLEKFFNNLLTSSSPLGGDAFDAIKYSLNLSFRAGVSKTLILLPCTSCNQATSKVEFSAMLQSLVEQDATLHVLMSTDFPLDNKKMAKKFFAMNNDVVYTKLDGKKSTLKGNIRLRKQVKITKSFGICSPLALQTNGTIFNGKKLNNKREFVVKWFSSIFTQRITQTASAPTCRTCQCTADENGLGKLECYLCDNPRFKYMSENEIDNNSEEKLTVKQVSPDVQLPDLEHDDYTDKDDEDDDDY